MKNRKNVVAWIGMAICAILVAVVFAIPQVRDLFALIPGVFFFVFFVLLIKEHNTDSDQNTESTPKRKVRWSVIFAILLNVISLIATVIVAICFGWWALLPFMLLCITVMWIIHLSKGDNWIIIIPIILLIIAIILFGVFCITRTGKNLVVNDLIVKDDVILETGDVNLEQGDVNLETGDVNLEQGDVNLDAGDVNLEQGDVNLETGNVNLEQGDVNLETGNVNLEQGDVNLETGNVNLEQGDVNLETGNVNLEQGDVNLETGNVNVGGDIVKVEPETETKPEPEAHVHNYTNKVVEPTCIAEGFTTYTCECGHSYKDNTKKALGHNYATKVVEPTCTTEGYTTYTCSRCNDSYKDNTKKALGHDYATKVVEPTCTTEGYTTYTCSRCNDSYKDNTKKALGHSFTSEIVRPTTSKEGYTIYTCTRCDYFFKDNYTDKLAPIVSGKASISVSTDYMVKGDTVIVTLENAKASDVVIKYVNPNNGSWVYDGATLKSIGNNQYRLMIDDELWEMAVDLTIGIDGNNNYHIVTLEPCYE